MAAMTGQGFQCCIDTISAQAAKSGWTQTLVGEVRGIKKTVICTGANGGIGAQYCAEMVAQWYHVVLACRNATSGQVLLDDLKARYPDGSVELAIVDMGSLASIKSFAADFRARHTRLDVLAHNAGVYFFDKERKTSADGIELNFAIHYVGP